MIRRLVELSGVPALGVAGPEPPSGPRRGATCWRRSSGRRPTGCPIRAQVAPRPVGLLLGLQSSFHPFSGHPAFARDRRATARGTGRARCTTPPSGPASVGAPKRPDGPGRRAGRLRAACSRSATCPTTSRRPRRACSAWPRRAGVDPAELTIDLLAENGGRHFLFVPFPNYADGQPRRLRRDAGPPRHRSSGWATAAPTWASSPTPASPPTRSRTGPATAPTAACRWAGWSSS